MKDERDVALNSRWSIAVTEGEMCVIRCIFKRTIPDLLALDARIQYEREDEKEEKGNGQ